MAKINTTNYQPVTAWNGTQDLLIVEQPDGTKVATPEQVKQYVEAGDFEATGEVIDGHGNILADMVKASELEIALAYLDNLNPTPAIIDGTPKNLFTLFKSLPKARLYVRKIAGTQSSASIFGGSAFAVIGYFSSDNYGWILCLSDNSVCGFKHLVVNDGRVAYLQRPTITVTSYDVS